MNNPMAVLGPKYASMRYALQEAGYAKIEDETTVVWKRVSRTGTAPGDLDIFWRAEFDNSGEKHPEGRWHFTATILLQAEVSLSRVHPMEHARTVVRNAESRMIHALDNLTSGRSDY